ncbi:coenzyme F420-0:L-glutamate ligase [Candidatus Saccharibacteria bacterium]|nr:coenzyme F420-0:L-glutamate ligase [Candidatus Saccharibacteria bacterium]
MKIEFLPIKTRIINPPKDDISDILNALEIKDGDIIFISSKVLGISEGRCFKVSDYDKTELIKNEVDRYLPYVNNTGDFHVNLTVNQNILIPSGGIDESNANGYYVLWPKNPDETCRRIRKNLMERTGVKNLGVIATDSHTTPLRWGVTGIAIGLAGVEPLEDIRGKEDLFGREMHITQIDRIDPLTSMAVAIMGESSEATPIVILRGYQDIEFKEDASMKDFKIDPDFDLYSPLIKTMPINRKEHDG